MLIIAIIKLANSGASGCLCSWLYRGKELFCGVSLICPAPIFPPSSLWSASVPHSLLKLVELGQKHTTQPATVEELNVLKPEWYAWLNEVQRCKTHAWL